MTDQLLTPKQVAAILKINVGTLEAWRARETGPRWMKLGSSVRSPIRYKQSDVESYLQRAAGVK